MRLLDFHPSSLARSNLPQVRGDLRRDDVRPPPRIWRAGRDPPSWPARRPFVGVASCTHIAMEQFWNGGDPSKS